jgi:H+/gluconate symporter-like permease
MRCRGEEVVVAVVVAIVVEAAVEAVVVGVVVVVVAAATVTEEEEEPESRCDSLATAATAPSSAFSHCSSSVFWQRYMCFNRQ